VYVYIYIPTASKAHSFFWLPEKNQNMSFQNKPFFSKAFGYGKLRVNYGKLLVNYGQITGRILEHHFFLKKVFS
jgi:hypothetical protein